MTASQGHMKGEPSLEEYASANRRQPILFFRNTLANLVVGVIGGYTLEKMNIPDSDVDTLQKYAFPIVLDASEYIINRWTRGKKLDTFRHYTFQFMTDCGFLYIGEQLGRALAKRT